jgi:glycogen synthase
MMQQAAMARHFSWDDSALEYEKLYARARENKSKLK